MHTKKGINIWLHVVGKFKRNYNWAGKGIIDLCLVTTPNVIKYKIILYNSVN